MLGAIIPARRAKNKSTYKVGKSLRFNSADSAYLSRLNAAATSMKKATISVWLRRSALAGFVGSYGGAFFANDSAGADCIGIGIDASTGVDYFFSQFQGLCIMRSAGKIFDTSAWCHFVIVFDTAQAVAANRYKIYCNGVEITAWTADGRAGITQNVDIRFFALTYTKFLSRYHPSYGYWDGYMAEYRFIDGQALTPADFGLFDPVTGQWVPKAYAGTYGLQGFYLDFADASAATAAAIGKDRSGNNNDFTPNAFSVAAGVDGDSFSDSPTNAFAILGRDPIAAEYGTLNNGGLDYVAGTNTSLCSNFPMMPTDTAVYYFELTPSGSGSAIGVGVVNYGWNQLGWFAGAEGPGYAYHSNGSTWSANVQRPTYQTFSVNGETVGLAFQPSTGKIWARQKDGTWAGGGNPSTLTTPTFTLALPAAGQGWTFGVCGTTKNQVNFGQRPFILGLPANCKRCCTDDLPDSESVITAGSFYGNADADGPAIALNGAPSSLTINGNVVTWGTHAKKLSYGAKVMVAAAGYNATGVNTFTAVVPVKRKYARAQIT